MVGWPSGLGGSLQNYLHRFKSCTDLKNKNKNYGKRNIRI